MTWKIRTRQLIIDCKVEHLHFEVSIFGPSSDLQAHCLSPTHNISCTSFNTDGHVKQILQTNTTVYTVEDRDISRFNGIWTCQHGSRKDETSTEVTIAKEHVTKSLLSLCTCIGTKQVVSTIVCRRVVVILISSYFFIMPFIFGFMEKTRCKGFQNNNHDDHMLDREQARERLQQESV
ncbi:unnamed protein product [Mytilus coruscus]|uniref:Uncharacterized protein n=1 Tax=Mytilus coruscus TaxID=42192 RepID=A0A6J8ENA6_MYTCO|nr:unnamed protein product [Mytilus coruscus]